jgi:hypothetical protein
VIREERGDFTLIGLLLAAVLMVVVLFATYNAFDVFGRSVNDNQTRVEATDRARTATDQIARQLRNLATPTSLQPNAVVRASSYDVIFETVSATGTPSAANPKNVEFVRYCLDSSARRLWAMELPPGSVSSATAVPTTSSCPGTGWSNARALTSDVVNVYNSKARPVFAFDTTTLNAIRRVSADLFVDTTPGYGSAEQEVSTGVDLRNQDAPPTARFTAGLAGGGIIVLDGSGSTDPDNDPLDFCWYDSNASGSVGTCGDHSVGDTPTMRYSTTAGTPHTLTVTVTDPSGLSATSDPQTLTSS